MTSQEFPPFFRSCLSFGDIFKKGPQPSHQPTY